MIISASRRTDIPTFYSEWFMNRIKAGFLYVRNPFNFHQVSKISLLPDVVDCIVFWTKNPIPMLNRLDYLQDYHYYFQFTLTGYGRDVEANLPDKIEKLIPSFIELSKMIGPDKVIWRYDPIIFNKRYSQEYHLRAISSIASALKGYTQKCVISFVDIYTKNKKSIDRLRLEVVSNANLISFIKKIYDIAMFNNIAVATCAEKIDLSSIGIEHNACIDKNLIERITGHAINVEKDKSQRNECQCVASIDVGMYNTCGNGCQYCYANYNAENVEARRKLYDPESPILCDFIRGDDNITERKVKSLLDKSITLL